MHLPSPSSRRIVGERRSIDYDQTQAFFDERASRASENHLTATMYQDSDLAARRDKFEKETMLPILDPRASDRVLDLGCGAGRWAEAIAPSVSAYLGIDFSENLLNTARAKVPSAIFQRLEINALDVSVLEVAPPFTLFLCSGIFAYINDEDLVRLFETISRISTIDARVYVREPVAKESRLTLDQFWSDDLQCVYSAIYRTRSEYVTLFDFLTGFEVELETKPFPAELQNRVETEQHCFVLRRRPRL